MRKKTLRSSKTGQAKGPKRASKAHPRYTTRDIYFRQKPHVFIHIWHIYSLNFKFDTNIIHAASRIPISSTQRKKSYKDEGQFRPTCKVKPRLVITSGKAKQTDINHRDAKFDDDDHILKNARDNLDRIIK